jgi:hypothetical protein
MSTASFSEPYSSAVPQALAQHISRVPVKRGWRSSSQVLRRRPTAEQGHALETLGHAIEYLVDSQMHDDASARDITDASRTLMRLSREVFADCQVIVPVSQRLRLWLARTLHVNA